MSMGIAILGAGIFARDEHLPAVEACSLLSLKAVYSRSNHSADRLAKVAEETVDTYYDAPTATGRSLDDLLNREDIDGVIIALPILVQPAFIKKAILAGKHVLSEKPIAHDVKTAHELLKWYKKCNREEIWSVAENFRFLDPIVCAAEQLAKLDGEVVTFSMRLYGFINADDKYYKAGWRKNPKFQGGCLLDSGIHFVAAIRHLLSAAGESITHVAAFTSLLQDRLAPLDTVHATMQTSNETNGTFSLSFGAEFKSGFEFQVVTDKGAVTVTPTEVTLLRKDPKGEMNVARTAFKALYSHAVEREVGLFAKAMATGKIEQRASPEEAFMDLRVLQAMLESGEDGGAVKELE